MSKILDYSEFEFSKRHIFENRILDDNGNRLNYFGEDISEYFHNDGLLLTNPMDIGEMNSLAKEDVRQFRVDRFNSTGIDKWYTPKDWVPSNNVRNILKRRSLFVEPVYDKVSINDTNLELDYSKINLKNKDNKVNINKIQYNNYSKSILNPNVEININNINLDDLYFNGDCVKIYKVDNPTIEKGFPTTDKGFLYVFNRYKVDRLVKMYIPNGGRMVTTPKHWFHSEKHYWVPRKLQRGLNNIFEGVKSYNIDAGLTYLGDNDTFYDRYKHSFKSVLKSYVENSYIDKSMLYQNDSGPITFNGQVMNQFSNVARDNIYDERKKNATNGINLNSSKKVDTLRTTLEEFRKTDINSDISKINSVYTDMKYYGIDHLMDNTSIFIDDPDCVIQMYVTPKRTYIRSNNDAETIYRHTALKNNPYFSPMEGLIRDLPTEVEFGEFSRVRKYNHFNDDYYMNNVRMDGERQIFSEEKSKLTHILNGKIPHIIPNKNLVPNHTHFMDRDGNYTLIRPLFRNSNPTNEDHIDIPSNLWIPKGLIYTEFGFFRDETVSDEELSRNLDSYNEVWKLKPENSLYTIKRYLRFNRSIFKYPFIKDLEGRPLDNNHTKKIISSSEYQYNTQNLWNLMGSIYNDTYGLFLLGKDKTYKGNDFTWDNTKKRFVPNKFIPLLSYTGEVSNKISKLTTYNESKIATLGDDWSNEYTRNHMLVPFVDNEYIKTSRFGNDYGTYQTRYFVYGLKGNALMFSNRDLIEDKSMYLKLPKLPKVLEPKKSFLLEGEDLKDYLKLVFKNMPNSENTDKLGFPATLVGIIDKNTYPINKVNAFNLDSVYNDTNKNMWNWATFMEKVKKGYPYRDEIKNNLGISHNMKWAKWTSFYYPDSDRHRWQDENDGWRHNIDFTFIDKVFSSILPNDTDIIEKYKPKFNDYILKNSALSFGSQTTGDWVTNVFGTGEKGQVHKAVNTDLAKRIYLDGYTGIYASLDDVEYPLIVHSSKRLFNLSGLMKVGSEKLRTFMEVPMLKDYMKNMDNYSRQINPRNYNNSMVIQTNYLRIDERSSMFAINKGQKRWKTIIDIPMDRLPNPNEYVYNGQAGIDFSKYGNYKNYMIMEKSKTLGTKTNNYAPFPEEVKDWIQLIEIPQEAKEIIVEAVRAVRDNFGGFIRWANLPQKLIPKSLYYKEGMNESEGSWMYAMNYGRIFDKIDNTGMDIKFVVHMSRAIRLGLTNSSTSGSNTPNYFIRKVMYR